MNLWSLRERRWARGHQGGTESPGQTRTEADHGRGSGHSELYRRRKCTVEPVFGQIKTGMGFRRFYYRGRQNVRSEWNLVCAAFNLRKIAVPLRIPPRGDGAAAMEPTTTREGANSLLSKPRACPASHS